MQRALAELERVLAHTLLSAGDRRRLGMLARTIGSAAERDGLRELRERALLFETGCVMADTASQLRDAALELRRLADGSEQATSA